MEQSQKHIIGYSFKGRPIWAFTCGNGPKSLHINASVHANEWITTIVLLRWFMKMNRRYRKTYLNEDAIKIWVVPLVNPDGVDLVMNGRRSDWKANARGVDLNDQFPAGWEVERKRRGKLKAGARDFGGDAPLSESESMALHDLVKRTSPDAVVALHTQGREIYYNYRDFEPRDAAWLAKQMGLAVTKNAYRAVKLSNSDAGFKDWFIQEFRKYGFTIEMGSGVNPLPIKYHSTLLIEFEAMMNVLCNFIAGHTPTNKEYPPKYK